jgi:hypothetical protein
MQKVCPPRIVLERKEIAGGRGSMPETVMQKRLGRDHLKIVSSRDDFLFSGKEDELFMQGVYSYGTGPE